jgi:hypothetical protein
MVSSKSNIVFFTIITFLVACSGTDQKRDFFDYNLTSEEMALLREGDILLRKGYGFVSSMIVKTLEEEIPVSHVGILVKDPNDRQFKVIHSVSQTISDADGVQKQDLQSFVRDSQPNTLIVVRYRDTELYDRGTQKISERAIHYLKEKVPFDYAFDFDNTDKFFCTEFIGRVIGDVFGDEIYSPEFLSSNSDLDILRFNVFFDPQRFDIIINHHLTE